MQTPTFIPLLPLPLQKPPTHTYPALRIATRAQYSGDQWQQYESRDARRETRELQIVRSNPNRETHHHVFLQLSSLTTFATAAKRFMDMQATDVECENRERLWILKSTSDHTFGTLRGEPFPPRAMVLETLPEKMGEGGEDGERGVFGVSRWIKALDRSGKAVSPMESHANDYVAWGAERRGCAFGDVNETDFVGSEMLNADWTNADTVPAMRERLLQHAKDVVDGGYAFSYEVFQSAAEPTVFKTLEVYESRDALCEYMNSIDASFAEDVLQYRAAVNRVRQLYTVMHSLYARE